MKTSSSEFKRFDETMERILRVPHSEIKAKLNAEKVQKTRKRKPKKTSAHERGDREDT